MSPNVDEHVHVLVSDSITMWTMAIVTDRFKHEGAAGGDDAPTRPESDANSTAADD